jgi:predicted nucleotidyltransferase
VGTSLTLDEILSDRLHISRTQIVEFCERWGVDELALFGSVLRDDFDIESSDIDVLIERRSTGGGGLRIRFRVQDELEALFGRKVDLVSKGAILESRNWLRKRNILESAQVIYAS